MAVATCLGGAEGWAMIKSLPPVSPTILEYEIKLSILKKAALYQKQTVTRNKKEYKVITPGEAGRSKTN